MPPKNYPYSDQFKPAILYGVSPLNELLKNTYLTRVPEEYNVNGHHMSAVSPDEQSNAGQHGLSSFFFRLNTNDNGVSSIVRPVEIKGKLNYSNCFVIEQNPGAVGLAVVMLQDFKSDKQNNVYCNIRYLPFTQFKDILSNGLGTSFPLVEIPSHDVIKLNITLTASNTGELLFRTFKTQVNADGISPENKLKLVKELEFSLANSIAQVCISLLTLKPGEEEQKKKYSSNYSVLMPSIGEKSLKEIILGVCLIGNLSSAHAGEIVVGNINDQWGHANSFIYKVVHS